MPALHMLSQSPRTAATYSFTTTLLAIAALVLVFAPAARADFAQERATERSKLITRLLGLAEWCQAQQIFLERDNTHRAILQLDPENPESRKVLRYARNADGTWKDPPTRTVQNLNKKALEQLPAKRAEALQPYADALLTALAREPQPPEVSQAVYADILAIDPDCARVRQQLGEVKEGGQWLLGETVKGKQRRVEIRAIVKGALEAPLELTPSEPTEAEKPWADVWSCGVASKSARVLGAGGTSDCEAIARLVSACGTAFGQVLGIQLAPAPQIQYYALLGADVRATFVSRFPNLDDERKKLFALAPGGGLPLANSIVLFEADVAKRNDCAARNALTLLMRDNFHVEMPCGWAYEGLGLYLTRELCGTRFTWYSLANPKTEAMRASLLAPDSNWMNDALTLLKTNGLAAFEAAMTKPVTQLDLHEMVLGYAFSAYLLEGRPEQAAEFLRACGAGKPWPETAKSVLGLSTREVWERLVRWLQERK